MVRLDAKFVGLRFLPLAVQPKPRQPRWIMARWERGVKADGAAWSVKAYKH
jgi:hypothetical protein